MRQLVKNTHTKGLLKLHESCDGETLTLAWEGKSVDKNPGEFLNPLLLKITEEPGLARVIVDLTELAQMNSSSMPSLIIFMKNLERKGIAAEFYYSADSEWQRIAFQMLANLAKTIPSIRVLTAAKTAG